MKRKILVFIAALAGCAALVAFGSAADKVVESMWAAGPMAIDGVAQEWEASTPIIDEASKAEYALRNDGRNLYVIMVFKNPLYKSTLEYTGMRIYFTTAAKKNKDFGVLFQKKIYTANALIASLEKKGQVVSEAQKAEIRKKESHIVFTEEVIRPKKAVVPAETPADSDPPVFRTIEKGPLTVCEFRIPLNRVNELGGVGAAPGQSIRLGFEWGGMNSQIMRDMMAGRSDRNVAAGERGGSSDRGFRDESGEGGVGGTRPGEIPMSEFNRDPRYRKYTFWVEAKLATSGS